jgi:hypothetical protein
MRCMTPDTLALDTPLGVRCLLAVLVPQCTGPTVHLVGRALVNRYFFFFIFLVKLSGTVSITPSRTETRLHNQAFRHVYPSSFRA